MSIDLSPYREDIDGASANRTPCVVATASARGEPNVSLRGSMMVLDDQHLAYWDRVHGRQEEHLAQNPHLAILYRDPPRRVSYRFYGQATVHAQGSLRDEIMARVVQNELDRDPERKGVAVVVRVDLVMTLSSQVLQRREDAPSTPPRTLNLLEAMHTARSIRRFRPDPVPQALVEQVLDAAVQAPSGTNAQTWRFVVVRDPDLRRQVGELYRQGFRDVYPPGRAAQESDPARRRTLRSADHLAEHMGDEPPLLVLACIDRGPGGVVGGRGVKPARRPPVVPATAPAAPSSPRCRT